MVCGGGSGGGGGLWVVSSVVMCTGRSHTLCLRFTHVFAIAQDRPEPCGSPIRYRPLVTPWRVIRKTMRLCRSSALNSMYARE